MRPAGTSHSLTVWSMKGKSGGILDQWRRDDCAHLGEELEQCMVFVVAHGRACELLGRSGCFSVVRSRQAGLESRYFQPESIELAGRGIIHTCLGGARGQAALTRLVPITRKLSSAESRPSPTHLPRPACGAAELRATTTLLARASDVRSGGSSGHVAELRAENGERRKVRERYESNGRAAARRCLTLLGDAALTPRGVFPFRLYMCDGVVRRTGQLSRIDDVV